MKPQNFYSKFGKIWTLFEYIGTVGRDIDYKTKIFKSKKDMLEYAKANGIDVGKFKKFDEGGK